MVELLLELAPDYRILEDEATQYPDQGTVAGWRSLPAVLRPE